MKTARSEKYDWSFFNIMHEKLKYLLFASTTWPDAITLPDMKNFKCPGGFDKKKIHTYPLVITKASRIREKQSLISYKFFKIVMLYHFTSRNDF